MSVPGTLKSCGEMEAHTQIAGLSLSIRYCFTTEVTGSSKSKPADLQTLGNPTKSKVLVNFLDDNRIEQQKSHVVVRKKASGILESMQKLKTT